MRLRKLGIFLCLLLIANVSPIYAANYEDWYVFEDGSSNLYGFIDREGNIVDPAHWQEPPVFSLQSSDDPAPGWSVARKEGVCGVIDSKGNLILPFDYESVWLISEELFAVKKDGKSGVIKCDGSQVLPFAWDELGGGQGAVEAGVLMMRKEGKAGWIDLSGQEKCSAIWDSVYPYCSAEGKAYVKVGKDRQYGIADIEGNLIAEPVYHYVGFYAESVVPVQKKQKWGYLNEQGEIALPFEYQEAESFKDGIARVKQDGEYFYIDLTGQRITPSPEEPEPILLPGRYAVVQKKGQYGLRNSQGELAMPCMWHALYFTGVNDYFIFKRDGAQRVGVIRADGTIIIDSQWHRISYAGGNPPLFLVEKDSICHYYDDEGELVFSWQQ